ncbi:HAMP domain-containing sensor histidine kinase [Marinilactibacillus sp. Marseille-P9653]|uniref:sensor histidine kinase n=1 Tax=Marinilactibacillus sp. Marseille-P9653 TaxID=2866583 RepID=UPI001CE43923|nr:HAMP domain-containing sensor histidine kinase [Marinilactibacillus sp. Marseille-P9653]
MKFPYFYQQMLGFLSVIIMLLTISVFSIVLFARNTAIKGTENMLFAYAESIVDVNLSSDQLSNFQSLLGNQGVTFFVFDNDGHLIFPDLPDNIETRVVPDEEDRLKSGERVSLTTEQADLYGNPRETAYVYLPYFNKSTSNYSGFVAVSAPVSQIERQMSELKRNLFNAFLISTVIAIIMSFVFARYQVKRVNRLRQAAHMVAEGDYDVRLKHRDRDEIDNLSQDFNKMIQALDMSRQEVARQEDRRKTFMQDAAHEMRTPLTTINGLLEGLEYDVIPESQRLRSIKLMRKETKRLIRLVNENLDYENIRSNRIMLNKHALPLTEIFEEIQEQMKSLAESSNNTLQLSVEEPITVFADYDRFKQILVNLIKNAIQFTNSGLITVTGIKTDQGTQIRIQDNGIGMTEDQLKNIWDRYYKADISRTNTKFGESGLGLSIVQQLVALHEASISVDSTPEKGTIFTIDFPDPDKN